jgi:hypothetical protein
MTEEGNRGLSTKLSRFAIVGILNTVIDFATFSALVALSFPALVANFLGRRRDLFLRGQFTLDIRARRTFQPAQGVCEIRCQRQHHLARILDPRGLSPAAADGPFRRQAYRHSDRRDPQFLRCPLVHRKPGDLKRFWAKREGFVSNSVKTELFREKRITCRNRPAARRKHARSSVVLHQTRGRSDPAYRPRRPTVPEPGQGNLSGHRNRRSPCPSRPHPGA